MAGAKQVDRSAVLDPAARAFRLRGDVDPGPGDGDEVRPEQSLTWKKVLLRRVTAEAEQVALDRLDAAADQKLRRSDLYLMRHRIIAIHAWD
jgi:hypothetical protein